MTIDRSKTEIEKTLKRYGATSFGYFNKPSGVTVIFEAHGRRIRFDLPMPEGKTIKQEEQMQRSRWRALLLCIKAKLESVASKIETFEEAFLAHVVMPDGRTVADHATPAIAESYKAGEMRALLPPRAGAP